MKDTFLIMIIENSRIINNCSKLQKHTAHRKVLAQTTFVLAYTIGARGVGARKFGANLQITLEWLNRASFFSLLLSVPTCIVL